MSKIRALIGASLTGVAITSSLLVGAGTASAATGGGQCYTEPTLDSNVRLQLIWTTLPLPAGATGYYVRIVYSYQVGGNTSTASIDYKQVGGNKQVDEFVPQLSASTICRAADPTFGFGVGKFS